jgi:hypothetical protein
LEYNSLLKILMSEKKLPREMGGAKDDK